MKTAVVPPTPSPPLMNQDVKMKRNIHFIHYFITDQKHGSCANRKESLVSTFGRFPMLTLLGKIQKSEAEMIERNSQTKILSVLSLVLLSWYLSWFSIGTKTQDQFLCVGDSQDFNGNRKYQEPDLTWIIAVPQWVLGSTSPSSVGVRGERREGSEANKITMGWNYSQSN